MPLQFRAIIRLKLVPLWRLDIKNDRIIEESRSKTMGFLTEICDNKMRLNYPIAINYKDSIFQKWSKKCKVIL